MLLRLEAQSSNKSFLIEQPYGVSVDYRPESVELAELLREIQRQAEEIFNTIQPVLEHIKKRRSPYNIDDELRNRLLEQFDCLVRLVLKLPNRSSLDVFSFESLIKNDVSSLLQRFLKFAQKYDQSDFKLLFKVAEFQASIANMQTNISFLISTMC